MLLVFAFLRSTLALVVDENIPVVTFLRATAPIYLLPFFFR
jgi:hypothetical protein